MVRRPNAWQELASTDSAKKIMLDDGSVDWLAPSQHWKCTLIFKNSAARYCQRTAFFNVAKMRNTRLPLMLTATGLQLQERPLPFANSIRLICN